MNYSSISQIDKTLRVYQQRAKGEIFSSWDEVDNVMFQMPTGTGKTRLFTSIISDIKAWGVRTGKRPRILIIAHRVELIEQISESLDKYRVAHGVIAGGKKRELRYEVQVASIQTITHHSNENVAESLGVDFVIIDEAHHSLANSYKKLWAFYPDAKKLGVTATPWRMNQCGFTSLYDRLIVSQPIKQFIQDGWLAPYDYYSIKDDSSIQHKIDNIDEFDSEGDYKISALEREMDNTTIRAQLLSSYLKYAKGKKGIIYSISRAHSDHICAEYRAAGVNIVRIDSLTPRDERRLFVNRFKEGLIDIIVNVDIFSEGFDCPDIEFIQLARPTMSLVKYIQQVGRGLRPTAGKTRCLILDNVGTHTRFGLPDEDRPWELFFIGEDVKEKPQKHRDVGERVYDVRDGEIIEGNEEMVQITESVAPPLKKSTHNWTTSDDSLITTLVKEKQCPPDLLASVFKCDIEDIEARMEELGINDEPEVES